MCMFLLLLLYQNLYSLYLLGKCTKCTLVHTHTHAGKHTHTRTLRLLRASVVFVVVVCRPLLLLRLLLVPLKKALSKNNYVFWHMHARM